MNKQSVQIADVYETIIDYPKNQTLEQIFMDILPEVIEQVTEINEEQMQERLAAKNVKSKINSLSFNGILLIILLLVSLYLIRKIMLNLKYNVIKPMMKDSAIMLPAIIIILSLNYSLSSSSKAKVNFYGILYYIDLDRFLMQLVTFIITWFGLGIIFSLVWQYQSQIYEEFESQDAQQLHRLYENMYLYGDPNQKMIQEKLQYHAIRQQFINPIDQPLVSPNILRNDFNFGLYLSKNQKKIYCQLLRINSFSIIPILSSFSLQFIIAPIFISILLFIFYLIQENNLYKIYTQIKNPYQYQPNNFPNRGIQNPPYVNLPLKTNSKLEKVIYSQQFNLRFLHSLIFIQICWFSWLFYAHRIQKNILEHTLLAFFVSIASLNVTILIPMIIKTITFSHQIYDTNKICLQGQYEIQELLDKVSHYLRFCNLNQEQFQQNNSVQKQSNQNSSQHESQIQQEHQIINNSQQQDQLNHQENNQYSMLGGQQQLIKYGFTSLINHDKDKYIKEAVEQYRLQILQDPKLLDQEIDEEISSEIIDELNSHEESKQQEEGPSQSSEQNQQVQNGEQQQQQQPKRDINQALKEYEQHLVEKLFSKSETSTINTNQLKDFSKYLDCNLPLWYIVLMIDKYFKLQNPITQGIRYNDICNYSGYNQYTLETEDMYKQREQPITLENLQQELLEFFTEEEAQKIVKEFSYIEKTVIFQRFIEFIEYNIVLFPK